MKTSAIRRTAVAVIALALTAASCSSKAQSGGGGTQGGIKTGPGVTQDTITLGVLTDLHGVFAATGTTLTNSQRLYWKQVNQDGGICGRQVKLTVKDHGYNVQQAVTLYNQIRGNVLALQQSLGSPMTTALLSNYEQDKMLAIPASWANSLLASPTIMIVGTTYQYEMINGIDWLLQEGMIEPGDTIGHIYFEGEYGENGLRGSEFAAEQNNLDLVPVKIKADDVDLSAQITNLKNAGASAVLLTAGPKQTASAASAMAALGYDVPIMSQGPGWAPELLHTAAAEPLEKHFYTANSVLVPSVDDPAVKEFVQAYEQAYPDAPVDQGATFGYTSAAMLAKVLQAACDNKDLTRQGILDAFRSLSNVDTPLVPEHDYTKRGAAPTIQAYIYKADKGVLGGLTMVSDGLYKGPDAPDFVPQAVKQQ